MIFLKPPNGNPAEDRHRLDKNVMDISLSVIYPLLNFRSTYLALNMGINQRMLMDTADHPFVKAIATAKLPRLR
jgi:hypothetical protein